MKISRARIQTIIREELVRHIDELKEAGKKPDEEDAEEAGDKPAPKKPPVTPAPNTDPTMDKDKAAGSPPEDVAPPADEEVPDDEDPADDELDDEEDGSEDGDEGDDDRDGGKISDELTGKRVQSITMEPKSKLVPGASEVVISFDDNPEPLKILVTKTGGIKFFYRGALHDMP